MQCTPAESMSPAAGQGPFWFGSSTVVPSPVSCSPADRGTAHRRTGRVGGTGRHVAAELVKRGVPVRALVRRLDERSEALQAMGIHLVVGNFADYASLLAALDGRTG